MKKIKTVTKLNINQWRDFYFKLDNNSLQHLGSFGIITNSKITLALNSFKEEILNNLELDSSTKLIIMFKIKTKTNQYKNISYMQIININNFEELNNIFIAYWNLRSDDYKLPNTDSIVFTYKLEINNNLNEKLLKINESGKLLKSQKGFINQSTIKKTYFNGLNFPNTMDFSLWGNCHFISETQALVYKKASNLIYHVEMFDKFQEVEVKLDEKIIIKFRDILKNKGDLSTFTRIMDKHEFIYISGELIVQKTTKKVSFLTKVKRDIINSKKYITMDLETRVINGVMTSYCVSIYDGKEFKSFYILDYTDKFSNSSLAEKAMLKDSIFYLMKRKYNNYRIYLHNFSKFDSVFLISVMSDLSNQIKPIIREGQIIDLRFKFAQKYSLYFRDSLLILPGSLRSLAENFGAKNTELKGVFPYRFVNNSNIKLNYVGPIPAFSYFSDISLEEYQKYSEEFINNSWDLRRETIKYCELDCFVLYQVISKFSDTIFARFRIDILKYPTISSLALTIYRSTFLKKGMIPLIHGSIYEFIQKSYTGGSVDVFKPSSIVTDYSNNIVAINKLYRYDVNSLYPSVMKNYPMPSGTPIQFEGDILEVWEENSKPFGIFEVEVKSPENIKVPLLQTRLKLKNGSTNTVSPIGTWSGHYFSDELYNAAKFGYTYKVKRGYLFERSNIFNDYVDFLYNLKKESKKGTPDYTISKLLLNSLYGRFGMNPVSENHLIIKKDSSVNYYSKFNVTNVIPLNNGKELISYFNYNEENDEEFINIKNISVVVSSIVTASARIHMTKFKTDDSYTLYYSDTDSIDIDKPLDPSLIGEELGKMKLEHIFDDAIYLAPKVYGGKTENYEYVRIKGLKNPIKFEELKGLLYKDSKLEITQEKWYKDISNSVFHVKDEIYTLMITENKRILHYNYENIFYDTSPIKLEDNKITV